MNRDRVQVQVQVESAPGAGGGGVGAGGSPTGLNSPGGLSKIKATAMLLKTKVAGTTPKDQKLPNKITLPTPPQWSKSSSNNSSATSSSANSVSSLGKGSIKSMIAAREDPALSCNKMPGAQAVIPGTQQQRAVGVKKVVVPSTTTTTTTLSSPSSSSNKSMVMSSARLQQQLQSTMAKDRKAKAAASTASSSSPASTTTTTMTPSAMSPPASFSSSSSLSVSPSLTSLERGNTQPSPPIQETKTVQDKTLTETSAALSVPSSGGGMDEDVSSMEGIGKRCSRRRNGGGALVPSQFAATAPAEASTPAFMSAFETSPKAVEKDRVVVAEVKKDEKSKGSGGTLLTEKPLTRSVTTMDVTTTTSSSSSTPSSSTKTRERSNRDKDTAPLSPQATKNSLVFDSRPSMSPRRHTTSMAGESSSSLNWSMSGDPSAPPTPALPSFLVSTPSSASLLGTHGSTTPPMSSKNGGINPTLRELQTPNIPTNLVQARILQQEEQKRRDAELAKIPITAKLRSVKKIEAVLVSDDEDELVAQAISTRLHSRPRALTASNTCYGGKQRGDRAHVAPVAIPKKLADQVQHILGRKLAGKGSVLEEREKEREEEALKPKPELPPIVLGQPRRRTMTSAHIKNMVSTWDTKVEEAKETTSEAERIRLFLEERSRASVEPPKSKVVLTGSELLAPLPSLPPPPPTLNLHHATGADASLPVESLKASRGKKTGVEIGSKSKMSTKEKESTEAMGSGGDSPSMEEHSSKTSRRSSRGRMGEGGYASGPELGRFSTKVETVPSSGPTIPASSSSSSTIEATSEDKKQDAVASSTDQSAQEAKAESKEVIEDMDVKRSGDLLVNKAVTSRPRRSGVRRAQP